MKGSKRKLASWATKHFYCKNIPKAEMIQWDKSLNKEVSKSTKINVNQERC